MLAMLAMLASPLLPGQEGGGGRYSLVRLYYACSVRKGNEIHCVKGSPNTP